MQNTIPKSAKSWYIALAVLLTIQATPGVGMILNLFYIFAIAGIAVAIRTLFLAREEGRSLIGAYLGTVAFSLAIISGTLLHLMIREEMSGTGEGLAFMFMLLHWLIVVVAAVFAYIHIFQKMPHERQYDTRIDSSEQSDYYTTQQTTNIEMPEPIIYTNQIEPTPIQPVEQAISAPIGVGGMKFKQAEDMGDSVNIEDLEGVIYVENKKEKSPLDIENEMEIPEIEETFIVPALRAEEKQVSIHKPEFIEEHEATISFQDVPISEASALAEMQEIIDERLEHTLPEVTETFIVPALEKEEEIMPVQAQEENETVDKQKEIAQVFAQFKNKE